jgi:hypothetical protein
MVFSLEHDIKVTKSHQNLLPTQSVIFVHTVDMLDVCNHTVCPRIEFTRGKKFLFMILRKNFRGITFFASSETPISVIKISVLIHCILKLTFFVQIWTLN